jgi:hypothetical protein
VRKLFTLVIGVVLIVAVVMIAMPRLWVKNKTARLVQDGKVTDSFRLYFGSDGRILLAPDSGEVAFAHLPERGAHAIGYCAKKRFRFLKLFAFGDDSDCKTMYSDHWVVEGVKWHFSVPAGSDFEVTWETDFRR